MPQLTAVSASGTRHAGTSATEQSSRNKSLSAAQSERLRERERILAEARADRQRFGEVGASGGSTSHVDAPDEPAASAAPKRCNLRIRFPDGSVVEETFSSTEMLSNAFQSLDALLEARGEMADDYVLLQAIPRRVFIREVLGERSLAELGLAPSATLSVLRGEDRGHVASGGVETALLTGDIDGLSYEEMMEFESRIGDVQGKRRPSKRMREAKTRVHRYSGREGASAAAGEEKRCAICLESFEEGVNLRTLWCRHCFHVTCIDRWLEDQDECPVCRKTVSQV